ncbi:expressed unknown protein [Seminavis robusta]|uniref:Uncharacterized protein n=1 Tax=Seminavis robusta TaxID=568900 RepID=A0A9N8EGH4_9STRA|nr:expressed unknown protein [Seminavis robusta]|eukprot:Sro1126_g244100.1 n/a (411) ;mRNA; r:23402-24634
MGNITQPVEPKVKRIHQQNNHEVESWDNGTQGHLVMPSTSKDGGSKKKQKRRVLARQPQPRPRTSRGKRSMVKEATEIPGSLPVKQLNEAREVLVASDYKPGGNWEHWERKSRVVNGKVSWVEEWEEVKGTPRSCKFLSKQHEALNWPTTINKREHQQTLQKRVRGDPSLPADKQCGEATKSSQQQPTVALPSLQNASTPEVSFFKMPPPSQAEKEYGSLTVVRHRPAAAVDATPYPSASPQITRKRPLDSVTVSPLVETGQSSSKSPNIVSPPSGRVQPRCLPGNASVSITEVGEGEGQKARAPAAISMDPQKHTVPIIQVLLSNKTSPAERADVLRVYDTWKASQSAMAASKSEVQKAEEALALARRAYDEKERAHREVSQAMEASIQKKVRPDRRTKRQRRWMPPTP